jgi:peptidoglycan/xylan/chitin deacetylase (PgdA/CDA1 family)
MQGGGMVKELLKSAVRRTGLRRRHLATARMCCERNVLATFGRRRERSHGRILCYHSVGAPEWGVNDISPGQLRQQIETALADGYRFVPPAEIARTGGGPRDLAVTFDDGLSSALTNAAPILAEYGVPWTLFVVSEWADGRHPWGDDAVLNWDQIEQLAAAGVEIGSHSATHPNMADLAHAEFDDELDRSRRTIADRLGIVTDTFAIPLGQSMNWTPQAAVAAREAGYMTIYAQAEETRPQGTIPRTFVTSWDNDRIFRSALKGTFDHWEEWF